MSAQSFILRELRRSGPMSRTELRRRVTHIESYFNSAIESLEAKLVILGNGRAATYAALRSIPGVATPIDVFELEPDADEPALVMTLHPVEPWGWYVESHVDSVAGGFTEQEIELPPVADAIRALLDAS